MNDQSADHRSLAEGDAALRATLPTPEKEQPDPFLQMSTGRIGPGGVGLFVVAVVAILSIVLYGLNGGDSGGAAPRPVQNSTAAAGNSGAPAPAAPQNANNGKS